MKKISSRIIMTVLLCSITMAVLVGLSSIIRSVTVIEDEALNGLLANGKSISRELSEDLVVYESIVSNMYQTVNGTIDMKKLSNKGYLEKYSNDILSPIIKNMTTVTNKSAGLYIVFDYNYSGKSEGIWAALDEGGTLMHSTPTNIAGMSEDDPNASFYYDAVKAGEGFWSDFYINNANQSVMSYSMPIVIDNTTIGIVGADMKVGELQKHVEEIRLYETGFAYLLNKDLSFLVHPKYDIKTNLKTLDNGNYTEIAAAISSNEYGVIDVDTEDGTNVLSYSKLPDGKILIIVNYIEYCYLEQQYICTLNRHTLLPY